MYVSLKDVAARAGVSFQTAGKVLNGQQRGVVAEATRQRILRAADELGYVRNALARSLVTRSTYTIGIIADNDWVLSQFVIGAERRARMHGHAVLIGTVQLDSGDARQYARQLLERRVDGVIAAAPSLENDEATAQLLRGPVKSVSIHHVPGGGVPVVGSDHSETGRLAAEHLLRLGHRRIATVIGPRQRRVVATRLRGFRTALAAGGVRLGTRRIAEADWSVAGGFRAAGALFDADPAITAIYAQSDLMAMGVLAALARRGQRIPDDCAVVGCDDMPFAPYTIPPLTTVHVPFYETGERAMSLLLDRIAGGETASRVLLPVHLVVRDSTVGGDRIEAEESSLDEELV